MSTHSTRPSHAPPRSFAPVETLRADLRERRDRIVASAARLMVSVDYDRIQVKDVADEADVALGTLYRYFNSKDHVFACALLSWSDGFGPRIERHAEGTTAERVRATYRMAARAFEREPRVYGALVQVQASTDSHAAATHRRFADQQSVAFGRVLEDLDGASVEDVLAVMGAVLDENLRFWQMGHQPIDTVYRAIDRAVALIFEGR